MQLSRFTDYSLRVLLYLAINTERRATLKELAAFFSVSLDHLRKIVHELSRSGYVNTFQGKNGGIELGREPGNIKIGEVVMHFEGHETFIDCSGLNCRLAKVCSLKDVLREGQEALFASLNKYTLLDLVESKPQVVKLLVDKTKPLVVRQH